MNTIGGTKPANEATAHKLYEICLGEIVNMVGNGSTNLGELNKVGHMLFGGKYLGTFTIDDGKAVIKQLSKSKSYAIINNAKASTGGEHWVALLWTPSEVINYDSFGRKSSALVPALLGNGKKITDSDRDAEQVNSEENCGARCLAWLSVADLAGTRYAVLV